jgi:hypothetical protein
MRSKERTRDYPNCSPDYVNLTNSEIDERIDGIHREKQILLAIQAGFSETEAAYQVQ